MTHKSEPTFSGTQVTNNFCNGVQVEDS
jgi:hypothetical protein